MLSIRKKRSIIYLERLTVRVGGHYYHGKASSWEKLLGEVRGSAYEQLQ